MFDELKYIRTRYTSRDFLYDMTFIETMCSILNFITFRVVPRAVHKSSMLSKWYILDRYYVMLLCYNENLNDFLVKRYEFFWRF